ncbi:exonuclease domain-containing protein [Singulisphaera sp. PoT]|uniref:exonuclease domain-containing protein n=1 Tax=Singulisphaera sp. PoT TaxID=3411797 RepID=UPI003BF494F0
MDFLAIDVETANASFASICQIGIVGFKDGVAVHRWKTYVDPREPFDGMNIQVHGITEEHVSGAPVMGALLEEITGHLSGRIVVCHTSFDRTSMTLVAEKHAHPGWGCRWLDSARVVRRVWTQFAQRGYGLRPVSQHLGIEFKHHDAEEDAYAAGMILVHAIRESGKSAEEWLEHSMKRFGTSSVAQAGDPDGPLSGETIVFTGALSVPRKQAAELAARAGCDVTDTVNKDTTLLVVGDQDIRVLAGHPKSSKHRKAESLIAKGQDIRIIAEGDFQRLISIAS